MKNSNKIMRNLTSFVIILLPFFTWAQNEFLPIDRTKIEKLVTDSSSQSFYPKLIQRFNSFDSSLTKDDYRLIYFGFVFQKNYDGYSETKKSEINKSMTENNFLQVIQFCDSILRVIPVSLFANYKKGYALFKLNENDTLSFRYRTRYRNLRDAILGSGNGLKCKSGFKVIFVSDEYELMYKYFENSSVKSQSLEGNCDHFKIDPSKYFKASDIYFDTSESLIALEKLFKK